MVCMAVDRQYIERLVDWVTEEAGKLAPGDLGVNAFSRDSAVKLAKYGVGGFNTTVVSRWINGSVKQGVKSQNLQRIGLLKGFSEDPAEAETLAYLWLSGKGEPDPQQKPTSSALMAGGGQAREVERIPGLSTSELQELAVAIVGELAARAAHPPSETVIEEDQPMDTPLIYLLRGWLNGKELEDLATELSVTKERADRIMQGYVLTPDECRRVAELAGLEVGTIVAWGACPALQDDRG